MDALGSKIDNNLYLLMFSSSLKLKITSLNTK